MDDLIGKKLGQYVIKEKIGHGGMAVVFKAYQSQLDRDVAIKVLSPALVAEDPNFVKRFEHEARSVARLHHPNILSVYDFGIDRDYSFIVMRYVEGKQTLKKLMDQSLSYQRIIELTGQIGGALDYAHRRGIIHRDVKPNNVLIDPDEGWALLVDFGLAKAGAVTTMLTKKGAIVGTPAYMSPEQIRGESIDHRTDIYALGAILYQTLTKIIPHDAATPLSVMHKRTTQLPRPLREIDLNIPTAVEKVVLRALSLDRNERYDSAVELAEDLKQSYQASLATVEGEQPQFSTPTPQSPISRDIPTIESPVSSAGAPDVVQSGEKLPTGHSSIFKRYTVWFGVAIVVFIIVIGLAFFFGSGARSNPTSEISQPDLTGTSLAVAVVSTPTSTPIPTQPPTPIPTQIPTRTPTNTPILPATTPLPTPTAVVATALAFQTPLPESTNTPPLPTSTDTTTPTPTSRPTDTPGPTSVSISSPVPAEIIYVQSMREGRRLGKANHLGAFIDNDLPRFTAAPAWSPNGDKIAFFGETGISAESIAYRPDFGIWITDNDGKNPGQIFKVNDVRQIAWSPDSTRLAFEIVTLSGDHEIWVIDAEGGQEISKFTGEQPAWSPNSQRLVLRGCLPGCGLWLVNFDGSEKEQLTSNSTDGFPFWSVSGEYLAFSSRRDENWEIYLFELQPNGQFGEPKRLTDRPATDTTPVFDRCSREIYLRTDLGGSWRITAMGLDGTGERIVIAGIGDSGTGQWGKDRPSVYASAAACS
jgi:serine/threonine protein kinase/Tol biopolymer transport system component